MSTVVAGADLVKFQAQLAAVVRANASALKKKERAKKKRDENSDNLTAAERAILADLD